LGLLFDLLAATEESPVKHPLLALSLALLAAEPSFGHGGSFLGPPYRPPDAGRPGGAGAGAGPAGGGPSGPTTPGPSGPAGPGAGPTTPGPGAPKNPFPLTPAKDELPDPTRWQLWWHYNRDAYLDLRARIQALATTSPENLVVIQRRKLQERLAPELQKCIEAGDKESVQRQTILVLARLAKLKSLNVPLDRLAGIYLGRNAPNLQEGAILALGIGGDVSSIENLRHVLMDDEAGRGLLKQQRAIPTRMRVFAAYSLGLLGQRDPSEDARRHVVYALLFALGKEVAIERELRVACALSLGLVPIAPCRTPVEAQDPARQIEELHLCGGVQTDYLLSIASDPKLDSWFRGHAAAALGRLAVSAGPGYAAADDHPAILSRDELVRALIQLAQGSRATPPVLQGCLLGLGEVVDADGDEADVRARDFFQESMKRDAPMAQRFALIALASALARPGQGREPDTAWKDGASLLLREFARAKGGWLSWNALALAVAGHGRLAHKLDYPQSIADALRSRLSEAQKIDEAATCALAIAVLQSSSEETSSALQKAFQKQASSAYRVCGAIALGELGVNESQGLLEKALDAPGAAVEDVIAASLGLRLLGDPDVVPDLVKRLEKTDPKKPEQAIAIVNALALLQDPVAGEPLLQLAADQTRDEDVRSAIVWCLGMLADPDAPDWTASYANDIDYNYLPWTLLSPMGDGRCLLDWR
jgi:hypothetical protein